MATKNATIDYKPDGFRDCEAITVTLNNGDQSNSILGGSWADKCVQFTGTFGAGGSVNLEGSNNNVDWSILTDPQGNAITKTAAGMEQAEEAPRYIRGNVTAGDGTTAIVMTLFARKGLTTV